MKGSPGKIAREQFLKWIFKERMIMMVPTGKKKMMMKKQGMKEWNWLTKAVILTLLLGLPSIMATPTYAAAVTDTTEKGGVAVNLTDDTKKANASGDGSVAAGEGAQSDGSYSVAVGKGSTANTESSIALGNGAQVEKSKNVTDHGGNSIAIGTDSKAGLYGSNNIAIGTSSKAQQAGSISIGNLSSAAGSTAVAIGDSAKTSGENSIALGHGATSSGQESVVLGAGAEAQKDDSVVIGSKANTADHESVAVGASAKAGKYAVGVGYSSNAAGLHSYAGGYKAQATGEGAYAGGNEANASGINSIAIGSKSTASKEGAIALGQETKSTGDNGIAIGKYSSAENQETIAMGYTAKATAAKALAAGFTAKATGENTVAIGDTSNASGVAATAIGYNSIASGVKSIALGSKTNASADFSLALGSNSIGAGYGSVSMGTLSESRGQWSVSIGASTAASTAPHSIAFGTNALTGDLTEELNDYKILENPTVLITDDVEIKDDFVSIDGSEQSSDKPSVPTDNKDTPQQGAIAIGMNTKTSGFNGTAVGQASRAYGRNAIAMGVASKAVLDNTIAIGTQVAASAEEAIGIGKFANSFSYRSIAMGARSVVGTKGDFGTALGAWSRVNGKNSVSLGSFSSTEGIDFENNGVAKYSGENVDAVDGVISVGTPAYSIKFSNDDLNIPDIKRRIVNVAGGINDNDAVNVKQLTAVADSPVYFYSGGTADSNKVSGDYNIRNIRLAFTDGLKAETDTEGGNSIVKVGLDKTYMDQINKAVKDAQDSATAAKGSQDEAKKSADAAAGSATDAGNAKTDAEAAKDKAVKAKTDAETAKTAAEKSAGEAKESANNAATSEKNAKDAADKAQKIAEDIKNNGGGSGGPGAGDTHGQDGAIAAGKDSSVESKNGTAIGDYATVGKDADGGTAIGEGSKVEEGAENSVALGKDSVADKANTVSVGSKGNERTITNVAPGRVEKGSTDAVNGGQLYEVSQQVGNNTRDIRDLREESRKADAMNAALAALHPVGYNPEEPTQIMAGMGTYRGEQAVALGVAHYVDGRTLFTGGLAYGGSSNLMANLGLTWRFGGPKKEAKVKMTKETPEVKALNDRVASLEETVKEQRAQIEQLIAMLKSK